MGYLIYCDGASRKDGRGGWGAHIRRPARTRIGYVVEDIYGGEYETTNNRMELMAAIEALWYIPEGSTVTVVCDSKYVVDGITEYIDGWERCGWRTSSNQPLKNADLWYELKQAASIHTVAWQWVKGHSGDEGNEKADELAGLGVPPVRDQGADAGMPPERVSAPKNRGR